MAAEPSDELDSEETEEDGEFEELSDDALLDEDALVDEEDDLDADDVLDVDDDVLSDDDDIDTLASEVEKPAGLIVVADADGEVADDDEDDLDDDEVEASLDVILKERLVVPDEEPEDDEETEATDAEDRADGTQRVLPKQPGEFLCQSCFLVKSQLQLADRKRHLCRDCV